MCVRCTYILSSQRGNERHIENRIWQMSVTPKIVQCVNLCSRKANKTATNKLQTKRRRAGADGNRDQQTNRDGR